MTESERWPSEKNTIADRDFVQAIGQFSLMYNYAEESLGVLFEASFHAETDYSKLLFQKLNNRERVDMLTGIVKFDEKNPEVRAKLLDAIRYYDICTANRNIVMHAISDVSDGADNSVIRLAKRVRNRPADTTWYYLTLPELRRVADECGATFVFIGRLFTWLRKREDGEPTGPLPDTPPQPYRLNPSEHVAASEGATPPPQPSGE